MKQESKGHRFFLFNCVYKSKVHSSQYDHCQDKNDPYGFFLLSFGLYSCLYLQSLLNLLFPSDLLQSCYLLFFFLPYLLLIFLLLPYHLFLLPSLFHLDLSQPLLLLVTLDVQICHSFFVSECKIYPQSISCFLEKLSDSLHIFENSNVDSSVSLVILVVNEKLLV